jgi:hypothetical protein
MDARNIHDHDAPRNSLQAIDVARLGKKRAEDIVACRAARLHAVEPLPVVGFLREAEEAPMRPQRRPPQHYPTLCLTRLRGQRAQPSRSISSTLSPTTTRSPHCLALAAAGTGPLGTGLSTPGRLHHRVAADRMSGD